MILNHLPRYTVCDDFTEGIMFLEHYDLSNFSRYNKSRRGQLRKKLQYLRSLEKLGLKHHTATEIHTELEVPQVHADAGKLPVMEAIRSHKVNTSYLHA